MNASLDPYPGSVTAAPARAASRPTSTVLRNLGEAMRRHQGLIQGIQWTVVVFYLTLVITPAFLPLPPQDARLFDNLTLFAQLAFWGVWWPFAILSMMLLGRVWCGVFCPEGFLTEQASRFGLGRPVPRWLKWGGWPFVAFVITTVYGQLVSVYEYPKAALLVLGGSTVAAIAVGLVYGRGKRIWCRHLCPASGVFALLSRLAPLHFRVEREKWDAARFHPAPVNCAPLVDIRRMKSGSDCHMCGRCSSYRDAVALSGRPLGGEILGLGPSEAHPWEARLLVFGVIGVAVGAFQWSASPWFVAIKQKTAEWLVERNSFWLLRDDAPWWLLTHYPAANDVFTWLDGVMILAYIGSTALLLGAWIWGWLRIAGMLLPGEASRNARLLAYSLTPLGGIGVFLGLSALTVTLLKAEGLLLPWLPAARGALLAVAALWSATLGAGMIRRIAGAALPNRIFAFCCLGAAMAAPVGAWLFLFYLW
jgi:polyferredoxin